MLFSTKLAQFWFIRTISISAILIHKDLSYVMTDLADVYGFKWVYLKMRTAVYHPLPRN